VGGGLSTVISHFADDRRLHGRAERAMRPEDGLQVLIRVLWLRFSINKAALANLCRMVESESSIQCASRVHLPEPNRDRCFFYIFQVSFQCRLLQSSNGFPSYRCSLSPPILGAPILPSHK